MKTIQDLADHLKKFRHNEAMFPTYEELVELCGHYLSDENSSIELKLNYLMNQQKVMDSFEENYINNSYLTLKNVGLCSLCQRQIDFIENVFKKYHK